MTSLKLPEDLVAESLDDVDQLLKILGSESQRLSHEIWRYLFCLGCRLRNPGLNGYGGYWYTHNACRGTHTQMNLGLYF